MTHEGLKNVDYLIVNEVEAHQFAQTLGIKETDPRLIAKAIVKDSALTCIITLESKGSVAVRNNETYVVGTLKLDSVDSTGAGDTFCGLFAAGLQAGHDWLKALHYAGVGAALSCLEFGAQDSMPFLEEVEARIGDVAPPRPPQATSA
jgi:ribokinase